MFSRDLGGKPVEAYMIPPLVFLTSWGTNLSGIEVMQAMSEESSGAVHSNKAK